MKNQYFLLFFLIFSVSCKVSKSIPKNKITEIDNYISKLSQEGKFNGNILVLKNGKRIYEKSLGFADADKTKILSSGYRFNIGSVYKEIPAIIIMKLQEENRLSVDDKLSKFFPDLPNWSKQVSIKNLLQYTSGLPRFNWRNHQVINDENLLKDLNNLKSLKFTPGTSYLYTNYSPLLLSKIAEKITGLTFQEIATKWVLKPCKMSESTFSESIPLEKKELMAISFDKNFREDKLPFTIQSSIFLFFTTTNDLVKLTEALHAYKLIRKDNLRFIAKTAPLENPDMESALGQTVLKGDEITNHSHHGSSGNYECLLSRDNTSDFTFIALTNQKNGNLHEIKDGIREIIN